MASLRVQPSREASRPRTRQQTMSQNSVVPVAGNKKSTRQKKATGRANYLKSSTIELTSPTFAVDCMSELFELYQQGICCDVVLSAGDCQTSAHKVVLMASSKYFKLLFMGPSSSDDFIVLPSGISGDSLLALVRFIYAGTLYLNPENVRFMLRAATQLMIRPAIDLCEKFLNENESMFAADGSSSFAPDENLDQFLSGVQIKEEVSFSDDDVPDVDYSPPGSPAESNMSTSSMNDGDDEYTPRFGESANRTNQEKSIGNRAKGKRKLEENLRLTKEKQRQSTSSKSQDEERESGQPLRKKSTPLQRSRRTRSARLRTLHQCHICGYGFENYSELLVHRKSEHKISPESHQARLVRKLRCRYIRMTLSSPSVSGDPGNDVGEASHCVKWSCPSCESQFSRRSEFRAHVLKLHPRKLKKLHLRRTGVPRPGCFNRDGVYRCPSCKQIFVHRASLLAHCARKHRSRKVFDCREMLFDGRKNIRTDWHCQQNDCDVVCKTGAQVKRHMATAHPTVLFSCPDCKFTTQVERMFLRHRAQRHGKMLICHMCGKGCDKLYQLRQHMYVHHNIRDPKLKLFQCSHEGCTYECSSKKRLEDHLTRHTLTKTLSCDVCGKMFKHLLGLERHKSAIHEGIRPYICDQCGMAFGLEHELKIHIARHSNNKPHVCHQCPYRTYDKINLHSHLLSQHNIQTSRSKILILRCDQCTFTSNRRGRFDDHMKKHQNIKDIPCPECGKLFHSKRNLYGHTVKVHRPKSLHCPLCNFATAIRSKFKEHTQKKHVRSNVLAAVKQSSEVMGSD